jgi:hypothetical protein
MPLVFILHKPAVVKESGCLEKHGFTASDTLVACNFACHPEYIQGMMHAVIPELVGQLGTEFFYDELLGSAIVHATGDSGMSIANV